jgi:hypothetical protein
MSAFQDYVGQGQANPGGHYRLGLTTGLVTGLTAKQAFFSLFWANPTQYFRLLRLKVTAAVTTAFTTAQLSDVALYVNRGVSVAPSGGTAVLPIAVGNNVMADTGVAAPMEQLQSGFTGGAIQIATTGALTVGTRVQDTQAIAYDVFNIIALGSADRSLLYDVANGLEYPLTLGANEGIELVVPTAQGAAGVVKYYVDLVFCFNNATF